MCDNQPRSTLYFIYLKCYQLKTFPKIVNFFVRWPYVTLQFKMGGFKKKMFQHYVGDLMEINLCMICKIKKFQVCT